MTNYRCLILVTSGLAIGCGGAGAPAVGEVRMVVLPARAANCELELVSVQPDDMAPGHRFGSGGQYQMIGAITLGLARGTDVMSEPIRALIRPRACAMGGEVVSLLATGDSGHYAITSTTITTVAQTDAAFTVWGPRTATPGPQKF
jgi:hypothetical protein